MPPHIAMQCTLVISPVAKRAISDTVRSILGIRFRKSNPIVYFTMKYKARMIKNTGRTLDTGWPAFWGPIRFTLYPSFSMAPFMALSATLSASYSISARLRGKDALTESMPGSLRTVFSIRFSQCGQVIPDTAASILLVCMSASFMSRSAIHGLSGPVRAVSDFLMHTVVPFFASLSFLSIIGTIRSIMTGQRNGKTALITLCAPGMTFPISGRDKSSRIGRPQHKAIISM